MKSGIRLDVPTLQSSTPPSAFAAPQLPPPSPSYARGSPLPPQSPQWVPPPSSPFGSGGGGYQSGELPPQLPPSAHAGSSGRASGLGGFSTQQSGYSNQQIGGSGPVSGAGIGTFGVSPWAGVAPEESAQAPMRRHRTMCRPGLLPGTSPLTKFALAIRRLYDPQARAAAAAGGLWGGGGFSAGTRPYGSLGFTGERTPSPQSSSAASVSAAAAAQPPPRRKMTIPRAEGFVQLPPDRPHAVAVVGPGKISLGLFDKLIDTRGEDALEARSDCSWD